MSDSDLFINNLHRWALFAPTAAEKLKNMACPDVSFCQSTNGEQNLLVKRSQKEFFLHSSENPSKEAKQLFSDLTLKNIQVIYIYGIGLGYFYEEAWEWLRQSSQHSLVFLEDDLEIVHRFLETERATRILYDRQTTVHYIGIEDPAYQTFDKFLADYSLCDYLFISLKLYEEHRPLDVAQLKGRLSFFCTMNRSNTHEYNNFGIGFFNNYFHNMLLLPNTYHGNGLFGKFKGVPAIISGAGPSLEKNIGLLSTLTDRALIFSGSTGLNALDVARITPHFAVGIDPNPDQFVRLVMLQSYETPFLYRNRLNHEALKIVHGNKGYVNGCGGYVISDWFEKQLGIEGVDINEGCNVLNFSLSIAHALGCNPIILVGIDLAYSKGHSYFPGIVSHPIHDRKRRFRSKGYHEELLMKNDIYGEPVYTLWKWMAESLWYANFVTENPDVRVINCTEGGIGFPNVINMTLADAAREFLEKQYDLDTLVFGEIQNSQMPSNVTKEKVREVCIQLSDDLQKCWQNCNEINLELENACNKLQSEENINFDELDAKKKKFESKLFNEPGYINMLKVFNEAFSRAWGYEMKRLIYDEGVIPKKEIQKNLLHWDALRYAYLKQTALMNYSIIREILNEEEIREAKIAELEELPKIEGHHPKDIEIEFPVIDKESQPQRSYYPDGSLKEEQYYKDGKLHGPSSFYSPKGQILSQCWFSEGLLQGKKKTYYANGALNSIQEFHDGKRHGNQEYFYQDGSTKSFIPYVNGKLQGYLYLYHPKGILSRIIHYENGKRDGIEKIWDESGILMIQGEYHEDKPVGIAQQWHPNGILAREVTFDKNSNQCFVKEWNEMGIAISEDQLYQDDYFDQVTKQTAKLTDSIINVLEKFTNVAPILESTLQPEVKKGFSIDEDLQDLKKKVERLQELGKELKVESGLDTDNPMEALWKSPSTQRNIEKRLDTLNKEMSKDICNIEQGLKNFLEAISKNIHKKNPDEP